MTKARRSEGEGERAPDGGIGSGAIVAALQWLGHPRPAPREPGSASPAAPLPSFTGATRLHFLVGDPVAQVRTPPFVTRAFAAQGRDAVLLALQVHPGDLEAMLDALARAPNVDGLLVTVPHKQACFAACATTSPRAARLAAVNAMRKSADGSWHGEMLDGLAFVAAAHGAGVDCAGRRTLLVGAGGAGRAIGLALAETGVRSLAVHDLDGARAVALAATVAAAGIASSTVADPDPAGFDLVVNASPLGMAAGDPLPVDPRRLDAGAHVGDVVTKPAVTPLIAAARARGCTTQSGIAMADAQAGMLADFLMGRDIDEGPGRVTASPGPPEATGGRDHHEETRHRRIEGGARPE